MKLYSGCLVIDEQNKYYDAKLKQLAKHVEISPIKDYHKNRHNVDGQPSTESEDGSIGEAVCAPAHLFKYINYINHNNIDLFQLRCSGDQARYLRLSCLLAAVPLGIILGLALHGSHAGRPMTSDEKYYLRFAGNLYVRMLRLIIVPLIIGSNVSTVRLFSRKVTWRVTLFMLFAFVVSVLTAEFIGVMLAAGIQPGRHLNITENTQRFPVEPAQGIASFLNLIRNFVPDNVIQAMFQKDMVYLKQEYRTIQENRAVNLSVESQQRLDELADLYSNETAEERGETSALEVSHKSAQTNILGLLTFSLLFGIGLRKLGKSVEVLSMLFKNLHQVMMFIAAAILWLSPIGTLLLIAYNLATVDDFMKAAQIFSGFIATEFAALLIYSLVVLPIFYIVIVRDSPHKLIFGCAEAYLNAAGTASSEATLPVSLHCMENCQQIADVRIARYSLSYGSVLHMPGTAIHQSLLVTFLAQIMDIEFGFKDYVLVIIGSWMGSCVTAGVSQGSETATSALLEFVGIPHFGESRLLNIVKPVDWVLDRARTMTNVHANCMLAAMLTKLCRKQLLLCPDESERQCDILQDYLNSKEVVRQGDPMYRLEAFHTILKRKRRHVWNVKDANVQMTNPQPLFHYRKNNKIYPQPLQI